MLDYILQKSSERGVVYHQSPGIWYSDETKRWFVTSPHLIKQVMYSSDFSVHTYDWSPVAQKLGIDLPYIKAACNWLPVAFEGERHAFLREKFARHIAKHTPAALTILSREIEKCRRTLLSKKIGEEFCFHTEVARPIINSSILALANVNLSSSLKIDILPLIFDYPLTTKCRIIDKLIGDILISFPDDWLDEKKFLCLGIIIESANTLLASVNLTMIHQFQLSPQKKLSEVKWGNELVRTGVPFIERFALNDVKIGPFSLEKGSRVRLFIESEGVMSEQKFQYSDVFFALGAHKCVGMSISRQIWKKYAEFLSEIYRVLRLIEVRERSSDYVFNFPNLIRVCFED